MELCEVRGVSYEILPEPQLRAACRVALSAAGTGPHAEGEAGPSAGAAGGEGRDGGAGGVGGHVGMGYGYGCPSGAAVPGPVGGCVLGWTFSVETWRYQERPNGEALEPGAEMPGKASAAAPPQPPALASGSRRYPSSGLPLLCCSPVPALLLLCLLLCPSLLSPPSLPSCTLVNPPSCLWPRAPAPARRRSGSKEEVTPTKRCHRGVGRVGSFRARQGGGKGPDPNRPWEK